MMNIVINVNGDTMKQNNQTVRGERSATELLEGREMCVCGHREKYHGWHYCKICNENHSFVPQETDRRNCSA